MFATFLSKIPSPVYRRCGHQAYVNQIIQVFFLQNFLSQNTILPNTIRHMSTFLSQRCVYLADWLLIALSMRISHGNDSIVIGIFPEQILLWKRGWGEGGIPKGTRLKFRPKVKIMQSAKLCKSQNCANRKTVQSSKCKTIEMQNYAILNNFTHCKHFHFA